MWQFVHLLLILSHLIQFPLFLVFGIQVEYLISLQFQSVTISQLCFFLIDIFINFNLKTFHQGEIITKRNLIIGNYLKKQKGFINDFFSFIGFLFYLRIIDDESDLVAFFLSFLFALKIYKIRFLVKQFEKKLQLQGELKGYLELLKLFLFIFFIAHILSCCWLKLGEYSFHQYERNWIGAYNLTNQNLNAYIYAMYFILMTMTTIGYGDIVPQNPMEMLFTLFLMLLCSAIFGYTLNSINQILDDIKRAKDDYSREFKIITNYMKKRNITYQLQMRVKNYFKFIWKKGMLDELEQEEQVLSKLSGALQEELKFQDKGRALSTIGLIKRYFSPKLIRKLSQFMHQINYSPGDIIQNNQGLNDMNLFYVYKGKVQCYTDSKQKQVKIEDILEKGYFGLENLFRQHPLPYEIKSNDFTVLYCLKKSDFLETINAPEFRDDYETYRMLLDKMTFDYVETCRCFSCSENNHFTVHCPYLSYLPLKNVAINRLQYSKEMKRDMDHDRRKNKEKRILQKDMQMKFKKMIKNLEFDLESINSESEMDSKLSWSKQQYRQKGSEENLSPEHSNQYAIQVKMDGGMLQNSQKNLSNPKLFEEFQTENMFSRKSLKMLPNKGVSLSESENNLSRDILIFDHMGNSEKYFPQFNCQKVLKRYWQFMMETKPIFFRKKMKKRRAGQIGIKNWSEYGKNEK